jgi:putative ABC transport system permease protein
MMRRWLAAFRRPKPDRELDDELNAYVAGLADDKAHSGMPYQEALRAARIELGGATQVKELVRDQSAGAWLERLGEDLRYGLRMLRRNPGFSAVTVLTLALGIGANTALFSVVHALLLRPLPYADADRLIYVSEATPGAPIQRVSSADFVRWHAHATLCDRIEGFGGGADVNLTGGGEPERVSGVTVTAGFLDLIGVHPVLGRNFTQQEDHPHGAGAVILSDALWRHRFGGSRAIVGKTLELDGRAHTVVGVLPASFVFPDNLYRAEMLIPMQLPPDPPPNFRTLKALARLKPGVTADALRSELESLAHHDRSRVTVEPLREWLTGDIRRLLLILQGAVVMVLLIACLNIANLQLSRATAREREMVLRAALGAGRGRLIRQLTTESLVPVVCGGALGLLLGSAGVHLLRRLLPVDLHLLRTVHIDGPVLAFTAGVTLATAVLTGLGPALAVSKRNLNQSLKQGLGRTVAGDSHPQLRATLVIAEVAAAMVLLAAAGLLTRSFLRLAATHPGFDPHGVLTLNIPLPGGFMGAHGSRYATPQSWAAFYAQVEERTAAIPGVESTALGMGLPLVGGYPFATFEVEGRPAPDPGVEQAAPFIPASPAYFHTLRIPLLRGRTFQKTDGAGAAPVAIVNQAFARQYFARGDATGKRLRIFDSWAQIVGVVGDVRQRGLREADTVTVYVPYDQFPTPMGFLLLRSRVPPESLANAVAAAVHAVDPNQPVDDVATMDERLSKSLTADRANMTLMAVFAGLALLLAAIGVFAVAAYAVTRRVHEIGIRMALGAQRADVWRLVLRQGMTLTAAGIGLGLTGSLAAARWLESLLFEVKAGDPLTLAAVAALFAVISAAACAIPARWATRVDPMTVLRHE